MARRNRRKNPMPTTGAIYMLKNGRRRKNKAPRRARRAKRSISMARVFARLKNRKRNGVAIRTNRRRNGVAIRTNRKRNGLAIRANPRRRGARGRFMRKNSRLKNRRRNGLALRTNPRRHNRKHNRSRRRRNGVLILRNPMQLGFLSPVTGLISKIPVVGKIIAPLVGPALGGALVLGVVHLGLQYAMPMVPAAVAEYVQPIGYTVGGAVLGLLVAFVPSSILSAQTKASIAGLAVVGGGAVDSIRYLSGSAGSAVAGLGDGGLWELGADDGILDSDESALMSEYGDAAAEDAIFSGEDLDSEEGEAILSGPKTWRMKFPFMRRMTHQRGQGSRHAKKHGHRWGWLIRMLGVKRFRALAAQPAEQRLAYIKELRKFAIQKAEESMAEQKLLTASPGSFSQAAQATAGWGSLLIAQ